MIIKQRDSSRVKKLELDILRQHALPADKAFMVEQEWKRLNKGEKGEQDAAYYLDFDFGNSNRFALIHDLRIEHDGRVAQIDHLLITRWLDVWVLETKSYGGKLEIKPDGSFVAVYGRKRFSVPSPVEQNRRHITLLEEVIEANELAPTRLGIRLPIRFASAILVDPKCEIVRPRGMDVSQSNILHADRFREWFKQRMEKMSALDVVASTSKIVSSETMRQFAESLARLHKPSQVNYQERFGIQPEDLRRKKPHDDKAKYDAPAAKKEARKQPEEAREPAGAYRRKGYYCASCKASISQKVARFCFDRKERFGGRAYCMDCQKGIR